MVSPDLTQNILVTIYLLFVHNYIAIAYLTGMVIGLVLALYRPSRFAVFILVGFATLLFAFEYDKHIIEPLRDQTTRSFVTEKPHYKVSRIVDLFVSDFLPVVFYVAGWGMVLGAIVAAGKDEARKNKSKGM